MYFLTQSEYDESLEEEDHPRIIPHGHGGIDHTLKDVNAGFKTYLMFVKKVASQLWNGNFNFSTCQVPTVLSNSKTFLELQSDDYLYFVQACKKMLSIKEPVQKMQFLATSVVAGFHNSLLSAQGKTPLNCFIGETLFVSQKDKNE